MGLSSKNKKDVNNTANSNTIRNSKMNADLDVLDQLVSSLLERHQQSTQTTSSNNNNNNARESTRLSRLKSLSFRKRRSSNKGTSSSLAASSELNLFSSGMGGSNGGNGFGQSATAMPTILESGSSNMTIKPQPQQSPTHSLDRAHGSAGVRQIINSIKNAPQRLSLSIDHHRLNDNDVDDDNDETSNLAKNVLD